MNSAGEGKRCLPPGHSSNCIVTDWHAKKDCVLHHEAKDRPAPDPPSGENPGGGAIECMSGCTTDGDHKRPGGCCTPAPPTAEPDAAFADDPTATPEFKLGFAAGRAEVLKQARPILDRISEENGIGIDVASRFAAAIRTGDGK